MFGRFRATTVRPACGGIGREGALPLGLRAKIRGPFPCIGAWVAVLPQVPANALQYELTGSLDEVLKRARRLREALLPVVQVVGPRTLVPLTGLSLSRRCGREGFATLRGCNARSHAWILHLSALRV